MRIDLDKKLLKSLLTLGSVVEARDSYTGGHTWRVAQFARILAEKYGLSASEIFVTTLGAHLHDLGKIGIPDSILLKQDALTDEEFAVIKTHPSIGLSVMASHPLAPLVLDAIAHHHERWDGGGYAQGVAGDGISIQARIITIADAFDAMTSTRPYRKGMAVKKATAILRGEAGAQFDPDLVDVFAELALANTLDHIVGHSNEGVPMVECPVCGPVIAVNEDVHDGAEIHCKVCKGKFRLHADKDTFDAEFLNEFAPVLLPEPDMGPINALAERMPDKVDL